MQQHIVIKAMLGGLLGTLGQILFVYGVAPLMAGQALISRSCEVSPVPWAC